MKEYQYSQMCCPLQTADQGESGVSNWNVTQMQSHSSSETCDASLGETAAGGAEYLPLNKTNYMIW